MLCLSLKANPKILGWRHTSDTSTFVLRVTKGMLGRANLLVGRLPGLEAKRQFGTGKPVVPGLVRPLETAGSRLT